MQAFEKVNLTLEELTSIAQDYVSSMKKVSSFVERIDTISMQNGCRENKIAGLVEGMKKLSLSGLSTKEWFSLVKEVSHFIDRLVATVPEGMEV